MEIRLNVESALEVTEYFERNNDVHDDISVAFIDFNVIEVYFFTDADGNEITKSRAEERIEEIKYTIYSARLGGTE